MTRTGQAAIDAANAHVGINMAAAGYCLQFTRECFDVGPVYGSAIDAWNGARLKHPGDRAVPPAVPVFFNSSSPYEHVCISTEAGTYVSTFNAEVRKYSSLSAVENTFGPYLGWSEDLNGVTVYASAQGDDFLSALSNDEQRRVLAWADQGQPKIDQLRSLVDQIKPNTDRLPKVQSTTDTTLAQANNNNTGIKQTLDILKGWPAPPEVTGRGIAIVFLVVLVAAVMGVIVGVLLTAHDGAWTTVGVLAVGAVGAVINQVIGGRRSSP